MAVDAAEEAERALSEALMTLASPQRLSMLRSLRVPQALREIDVTSERGGGSPRPASRQAVRGHLDRLLDAGMVVARKAQRPFGETLEYVVNHQAVFALAEEVRDLARRRGVIEPAVPTIERSVGAAVRIEGPSMILVKGVDEGHVFDLSPERASSWTLGRRRGVAVSLDYDPFVSSENSLIEWRGGRHVITDLPSSRNGTSVDFGRLPPGASAPLREGAVIGVGRSMLVYRSG